MLSRAAVYRVALVALLGFVGRGGHAAEEGRLAPAEAAARLDLARQLNEAFVHVAETVSPSVVVVLVRPKTASLEDFDHAGILDSMPEELRKRFKERLEQERKSPAQRLPEGEFPDQGSGVLIREDGYVLTNGHVVENAERIEVRLKDGRRYPAEVKGIDTESDIAVLKVDAVGLPAARMGDSAKVRVGEFAIAIGAPFELAYSVTFGHISAKGRRLTEDVVMMDQDFLQTDASINPGNSGGPLVNIEGEVIGINTLIRGLNRGIGFAVPMNLAREVAAQLIDSGRFTRAWLGVNIDNAGPRPDAGGTVAVLPGAVPPDGVLVTRILRDGPSWGSELETLDVIVAVDGEVVRDVGELKRQVSRKKVGSPVALDVVRGGRRLTVRVTPGELPSDRLASARPGRRPVPGVPGGGGPAGEGGSPGGGGGGTGDLTEEAVAGAIIGVQIRELDAVAAEKVGLERNEGVVVVGVVEEGLAFRRRIRPGDVITKVNRRPVRTPKDFVAAMRDADPRKGVPVTVVSEPGRRRFEVLKQALE